MLLGPDFPRYCYQKCSINGGVGLAIAKSHVKESRMPRRPLYLCFSVRKHSLRGRARRYRPAWRVNR